MRCSVATPAPQSAVVAGERIEKACQEAGPHSVGRHDNHCHYLSPIQSSHRGVPGENHLVPADPSALHFPGSLRRFQVPFGIFQTYFANRLPECWLPKRRSRFRSSRYSKHSRAQKEEDLFPIPTHYSSKPLPQHSPCSARPAPADRLPPKTSPRYQNDRARLRKKGSIEKNQKFAQVTENTLIFRDITQKAIPSASISRPSSRHCVDRSPNLVLRRNRVGQGAPLEKKAARTSLQKVLCYTGRFARRRTRRIPPQQRLLNGSLNFEFCPRNRCGNGE